MEGGLVFWWWYLRHLICTWGWKKFKECWHNKLGFVILFYQLHPGSFRPLTRRSTGPNSGPTQKNLDLKNDTRSRTTLSFAWNFSSDRGFTFLLCNLCNNWYKSNKIHYQRLSIRHVQSSISERFSIMIMYRKCPGAIPCLYANVTAAYLPTIDDRHCPPSWLIDLFAPGKKNSPSTGTNIFFTLLRILLRDRKHLKSVSDPDLSTVYYGHLIVS